MKNKITIDFGKWATARQLAIEKGWNGSRDYTQRVTNIVNRHRVKTWEIPELRIRLIDRVEFYKAIHN